MTLIQILLLVAIALLIFLYARSFKNRLVSRLAFIVLFFGGMIAVIFPELTNQLANFVGVGRGADLLTYILVIVFYASFYFLYSKINNLKAQQTEIIRTIAINNTKFPDEK